VAPGVGRLRCKEFHGVDYATYGYTDIRGTIWLNTRYALNLLLETLIHEWGHARVGWKTDEPHTQAFWRELGRITNSYHIWKEETLDEEEG
jgi:hypothetical protein